MSTHTVVIRYQYLTTCKVEALCEAYGDLLMILNIRSGIILAHLSASRVEPLGDGPSAHSAVNVH